LQAVRGVSDLINKSGYINLDFADIRSVMKNSRGIALVGIGSGAGEDKARKAAMSALTSPLLGNIKIEAATGIILNITIGPDMPMEEVMKGASYVTDAAGENVDVKFGVVTDNDMGDEIRMTVVATGLSTLIDDGLSTHTHTHTNTAAGTSTGVSATSNVNTASIVNTYTDTGTNTDLTTPTSQPLTHTQHVATHKTETTKTEDSKSGDLFDSASRRTDTGVRRDKKGNYNDEDFDIPPYLRNQNRAG
jgi:cell division GTPase FtsZ